MNKQPITQATQSMLILAFGGFCSILLGMGLARFVYTPILELNVSSGWLTANQANYLGFVNFLGYLLGALTAWKIVNRFFTPLAWVKFNAILCALSILACAYNAGFIWFSVWRWISGFAGAILIITTPSMILNYIPPNYTGRINGLVFSGIGAGIILSGYIVPKMLPLGLSMIWVFFGIIAFLAAAMVLFTLSKLPLTPEKSQLNQLSTPSAPLKKSILTMLGVSYAFAGAAFVPYVLFLAAYLTSIKFSTPLIGYIWTVFGVGGIIGTAYTGYLGDKFGIQRTLCLILFIAAFVLMVTILIPNVLVLTVCSFIIGLSLPATVTLTCAAVKTCTSTHHAAWAKVTIYFAIGQTIYTYIIYLLLKLHITFSFIFFTGSTLFIISAISAYNAYCINKRLYLQEKYCQLSITTGE